ncbi:long-chain fatty acid--CoA ligase [bacterium]|jgi:long-chain acyl-CoA synthetase|nr:long-chain fatty acid--CoA ligase [bacterium]
MSSILHRLAKWASAQPNDPAQIYKHDGKWVTITAKEYCDRVYHLAVFLDSHGIGKGTAGAILSYNCPQWLHMELALMLSGSLSAGIYPNSTSHDIQYVLNHAGASILAVQNREYYEKVVGPKKEFSLPSFVKLILVFDDDKGCAPNAVAYSDAIREGAKLVQAGKAKSLQQYLDQVDMHGGAFLIYTSGTTGNPKGALLSHDNLTYTSDIVIRYWKLPPSPGTIFSFLPISHIAEKLQSIGVGITQRYTIYYCTKFENVAKEVVEVQPTLLLCVPRVWEKMMEGVLSKIKTGKGLKKAMANWALDTGDRVANAKFGKKFPNPLDLIQYKVAEPIIINKVKEALGLKNAMVLASGAAMLPAHVSRWFRRLGLEILEDYGQTETTGVVCMTQPGVESAGTVGRPLPGIEFKLAEDGEILSKGRHIFVGYYKDQKATDATLIDGWVHTGDLGETTDTGLIRIRGRKKEILKTSGGKMIAPLPIEEKLKAKGMISQACMVGDNRKYLSILLTLDEATTAEMQKKSGAITGDGLQICDAEVVKTVQSYIDSVNSELASYEQIKRFVILAKEFSIAGGEMTPTLKMKRNVVEKNYNALIESMYA